MTNFAFVKEVAARYADRIPSSFFFADAFLQCDKLLGERLLIPRKAAETKSSLALQEGGKLKKLMQYLRFLFRESPRSRHEQINELKGLLQHRQPGDEPVTSSEVDDKFVSLLEQVLGPAASWDDEEWAEVASLLEKIPFEALVWVGVAT